MYERKFTNLHSRHVFEVRNIIPIHHFLSFLFYWKLNRKKNRMNFTKLLLFIQFNENNHKSWGSVFGIHPKKLGNIILSSIFSDSKSKRKDWGIAHQCVTCPAPSSCCPGATFHQHHSHHRCWHPLPRRRPAMPVPWWIPNFHPSSFQFRLVFVNVSKNEQNHFSKASDLQRRSWVNLKK